MLARLAVARAPIDTGWGGHLGDGVISVIRRALSGVASRVVEQHEGDVLGCSAAARTGPSTQAVEVYGHLPLGRRVLNARMWAGALSKTAGRSGWFSAGRGAQGCQIRGGGPGGGLCRLGGRGAGASVPEGSPGAVVVGRAFTRRAPPSESEATCQGHGTPKARWDPRTIHGCRPLYGYPVELARGGGLAERDARR